MRRLLCLAFAVTSAWSMGARAQEPTVTAQVEEALKQASAGELDAAVTTLQRIASAAPRSFEARISLGRLLDLQGRHATARKHLEEAVRLAPDDERNGALSALGISYAFESKPDESARYYQRAFDAQIQADNRAGAAGFANALGRIYLESGNLQKAQQWYTTGYETARKIPGLTPGDSTLWEMRRHNALGRIAARRGDLAAAREHAAAVSALLDKGTNEGQRQFYPYLLGYIAFFTKDYRQAIDELMKGDLNDPFVLGLIAQTHDKLGQRAAATEYYRKVMAVTTHSINSAFARPRARAFLR
jgi:tetratricopeptide (TPR) repeat protein